MNTQIQPSNLIGNINLGQRNSSAWSVHRELGHQHGPAQPYDNIRRRGTIHPLWQCQGTTLLAESTWAHDLLAVSTSTLQLSHLKKPAFDGSAKAQI